jgi:hypothetical protein
MSYTTKCKSNNSSIGYKCNSDNCISSICNRQTETGCRRAGRQDALDDAMWQTLDRLVATVSYAITTRFLGSPAADANETAL